MIYKGIYKGIKKGESGFTLIELLMVAFLLSILGVSVLQVITQIQSAAQAAEDKRLLLEQNFRAFTTIRSQLMAPGTSPLPPLQSNQSSSQAFAGRAFGMNRSFEVIENPQTGLMLRFVSRASSLANPLNRLLYGEVEVRLFIESNHPERPLVMEYWNMVSAPVPGQTPEPVNRIVLLKDIEQFSLRSYAFNGWQENWDNPYAPKPTLLELTIIRSVENRTSEVFRAAIPLYQSN